MALSYTSLTSGQLATALSVGTAYTTNEATTNFAVGVYTISFSGGGTAYIDFYNGSTFIGQASGSSPFNYNLATAATNVKFTNSAACNMVVSLTSNAVAQTSGTLYTYTSSQTITLTGAGYCLLVGGGGGGGGGTSQPGGGGGSGYLAGGRVSLTGSMSLVIGSNGNGGYSSGSGNAGGATTFAGYTANGGSGGTNTYQAGAGAGGGYGGNAGYYNNGGSGNSGGSGSASASSLSIYPFFTQGTTGGGGGCFIS
jgi:hypothetical protein